MVVHLKGVPSDEVAPHPLWMTPPGGAVEQSQSPNAPRLRPLPVSSSNQGGCGVTVGVEDTEPDMLTLAYGMMLMLSCVSPLKMGGGPSL